jgi:predicted dehydrogenase
MVHVGIVGLDNWYHAFPIVEGNAKEHFFTIEGVWSENRPRLEEFAKRFGVAKTYDRWEDLVVNSSIDAVLVCNPTAKRVEPVVAAIAAGKHVLCDKPMTLSLKDAERIVSALEKTPVRFAMLHNYRYTPEIMTGKELLSKGTIGSISSLTYSCRKSMPEDWPGSATQGWYADPLLSGGGGFVDHAAHALDVVLWYLEGHRPTDVQAVVKNLGGHRFSGEDYGMAVIQFGDHVVATVESTWTSPKGLRGTEYIQITGDQGEMLISRTGKSFVEIRRGSRGAGVIEHIDFPDIVWTDVVNRIVANFVKSIEGKDKPLDGIGAQQGRNVVQLLEAVYTSAARGSRMPV